MEHYKLFIDGEFVEAQSGATFETIDPGTSAAVATVAQAGAADAETAISAARRAFDKGEWSGLRPTERAEMVYRLSTQITQFGPRLGLTECMDSGQPLRVGMLASVAGVGFLNNFAFYAANQFPWEEEIPYSGNVFSPGRDFIRREPLGVCVGIIPWNFPLLMAFWKISHAIVMGNTVVLKPASATPLSALVLAEAVKAAGIPRGVVNIVTGPGTEVGEVLCVHPDVDKVAFTGSTEVGRQIMKLSADTVKNVTLELGGKSANIILDDADMELAVEGAILGTFLHQGQVCESGTRILVSSKIYDEFVDKLKKRTEAIRVGYQLLARNHLGPLVNAAQLATTERYVELGKTEGAEILTGGERLSVEGYPNGFYYAPTLFTNVDNAMRIAQEEIFGPVACIIKFNSDEEAVAIANDSKYGLAGGIFSTNHARAERLARGVRTGTMWINTYHNFGAFCPFGGYKQSGVGREFGQSGLSEYTQIKRYHIASFPDNIRIGPLSDNRKPDSFQYNSQTDIISGYGSLSAIYKEIAKIGCKRALVLTDSGVRKAGLTQLVQNALVDYCVGVFDEIEQDTNLDTVDAAASLGRELRADCVVSVGGGSVIDTGKAACVVLKNGGRAHQYLALGRLQEPQIPHIVIPTTSGTGSEVTGLAVIKNREVARKVFIGDDRIKPNVAILDPRFTVTLPAALTASTAMDAMTHAIEALTSIRSNNICDGQALHAIRLIHINLPIAIRDGKNREARSNLQHAATMAGWAISGASVGLAHAMAHTLGVLHDTPHGTACGIVLPKVMRFNLDYAVVKLAMVAQALSVDTRKMDDRAAALAAADAIESFMQKVGHPTKLSEVKVPEENLLKCSMHAFGDFTHMLNARGVRDPQVIFDLYQQAY